MRNRRLKQVLFVSFFLIFLPILAQARLVKVGVYANKPLVFKDLKGRYQGIAIDVLRSAAQKNGWELKFIEGTWQQCLQRLQAGQLDLQVAIADSQARRKLFSFTTTPLITNWGRLYSSKQNHLESLLDLDSKTISIVENDIHAKVFSDLMEKFGQRVILHPVDGYDQVMQEVSDQVVDAGVVNRMYAMLNAQRFSVRKTPMIFNPIQVHYATPLDDNIFLLTTLSKHLRTLKDDPGSVYYQSLEKWFGKQGQPFVPEWLRNALVLLGLLAFMFFLSILVLKQQVAARTRELRESRHRYKTLFARSTDAIFLSNLDGKIIDANEEACQSLGYSHEELVRLTLSEIDQTAVEKQHVDQLWPRLNAGKTVTLESRYTRQDGSSFPVEIHVGKIEVLGEEALLGVVRDITERKRIEAERDQALYTLADERERLSVTLRSIGDGVIATDEHGVIVFINRVTELLTGWSEQEAMGCQVEDVFHIINEKTGKRCENPVEKILAQGVIIGLANHTALISRDGVQRAIADSGAPIRDRNGHIIGTVLVFQDVTRERKTETELLKIKKLESIGILAGGIAHDFNNILAAILGNINLAQQYLQAGSDPMVLLQEAEKASTRATQLTQQLLTFSKGGTPVKKIESLPEIIRESAEFVLHGTNIACTYHIPDDLWMVEIDRGQMGQVIQNLVINSSHAMPEGGTITLSCENIADTSKAMFQGLHDEKYVRIIIQDTGVGIPEKMLDKIFDPYFTTKQDGSGLGLAITHSIINKHDGYIQVHSQVGHGTTFTLYLPAWLDKTAEDTSVVSNVQAGTGTVLIMDDEHMVVDIATRMLEHLGFTVVATHNGEEALAEYRRLLDEGCNVTAIIMDLTIPGGMGGKEAVHEIHRINASARVIAASGYSTDPILAQYKEYGFSGSICKPFSLSELSQAINTALL